VYIREFHLDKVEKPERTDEKGGKTLERGLREIL